MRLFSAIHVGFLLIFGFGNPVLLQGQNPYERIFAFFPERIPPLATDPPVVTTENDGRRSYTNVSFMYYAADGSIILEIKLKDFNMNPKNYEDELEQVQSTQNTASLAGRAFVFQDFTAFEKRKENVSSWIIFLGDHIVLDISCTAQQDSFPLIAEIAGKLNLAGIKASFLQYRSTGRF